MAWIEKQYLQDILYWIQRVTSPTFPPQGHWLMATWTWVMEARVLDGAKSSIKWLLAFKTFLFQKGNYSSRGFWNFPIWYWWPQGKLSSLHPASGVWTGILLIQFIYINTILYIYIYIYIYQFITDSYSWINMNKYKYLDILRKHCRRFYKILKYLLKNKNVFFNLMYVWYSILSTGLFILIYKMLSTPTA